MNKSRKLNQYQLNLEDHLLFVHLVIHLNILDLPGNYSTALPQVQVRTLTEREEFLTQSQERSCGTVVYTGMNNRGDFFIGNKRVSSATGQERTFDAPIPTVTGEDPSRLSVIFDEVIVKERLVVEGGKSRTIPISV